MIRANISDIKNRLSHYLRLVRGGEQVEILDRNTPLARIIHVSQIGANETDVPWIDEVVRLGIVTPPRAELGASERLSDLEPIASESKMKPGVLAALLAERGEGR